ncbi:hypothetical protein BK125_20910 [Paenibacillus odorifer]|uniref:MazF family transcriptional regulator n=1 Tax=Paenibacillus odorifer TaxID=189426 RepID=A0ABX3GC47_9BACL|nr:type II toxin-antitoxin system PemK/MazF family toxin [Paenibacillus odorifer]OMC74262.1 hypothetical protein BK125_20910 [Paenibacillus odorifer]OMC94427.1 hypothetical protein BSO21_33950 [Paenibacillus odorifer]
MNLKAGQVFWYEVDYPKTGETEIRPVAIVEIIDGLPIFVVFVALTHSKIKNFEGKYDKWKIPLFKGRDCGLGESSFAKVNCVAQAEASSFNSSDYIGQLNPIDLKNVKKKLMEFLDSGDGFW